MPESDGYVAPTPSGGGGNTMKIAAIVIIAIVVVAAVVIVVIWNPFAPSSNGPTYQSRTIKNVSQDINLWPTFYREEFSVSSSETQTTIEPDLYFQITVLSTGTDSVSVTITYEVYEVSQSMFDSLSWSELDPYLLDSDSGTNSVGDWINLNNYADTYTWVIIFEASSKNSTWDVDVTLTLRYNWQT